MAAIALSRKCLCITKTDLSLLKLKLSTPLFSSGLTRDHGMRCLSSHFSKNPILQPATVARNFSNFGALNRTRVANVGINSLFGCRYGAGTENAIKTLSANQPNRKVFTSNVLHEKSITEGERHKNDKLSFSESMALRLVNENGFLSWCRNSYIVTVAGISMINGSESTFAAAAGNGLLFIAGINMLWGSGSHISNLIRMRKITGISTPTLVFNVAGALLHALLYVFLLLLYKGFFEKRERGQWRDRKGDSGDRGHHDGSHHHRPDFGKFINRRKGFGGENDGDKLSENSPQVHEKSPPGSNSEA